MLLRMCGSSCGGRRWRSSSTARVPGGSCSRSYGGRRPVVRERGGAGGAVTAVCAGCPPYRAGGGAVVTAARVTRRVSSSVPSAGASWPASRPWTPTASGSRTPPPDAGCAPPSGRPGTGTHSRNDGPYPGGRPSGRRSLAVRAGGRWRPQARRFRIGVSWSPAAPCCAGGRCRPVTLRALVERVRERCGCGGAGDGTG